MSFLQERALYRHALLGCSGLLLGCGITAIGGWCYRLFTLGSSRLHVRYVILSPVALVFSVV